MATPTLRFTKAVVEAVSSPATGRNVYRDEENRHLHLFVTSTAKTFYLIRKVAGRMHFVKIGRHPELTISEARALASEKGTRLAKGDAVNRPSPDKVLFGELFAKYMEGHAKPHKRTWQEDQRKHDTLFAMWDGKAVNEIDRETVNRLHKRLGSGHGEYLANRALALLKGIFNYGRDTLQLNLENPAVGVKTFDEQDRARFLNAEELSRFFTALNSEETPPDWRDFFSLALWTGARRANVQAMRWDNLDLTAAVWTIPGQEFKNKELFRVVLTEPAIKVLKSRRHPDNDSPYVFPSRGAVGHIVEPRKAWRDLLKRAGLRDLRVHDLRRTLGSWQAATGASLQVIGKTLGHRNQRTTEIYARLNLDPVKASLNTATTAMLVAINGGDK
ncbi:MAG: tyrosine-type recombinase/integrase [bacterium]|jgi:integrase